MKYTKNFKLNKPELTDVIDIREINDNFDAIDSNLMAGLVQQEQTASEMDGTVKARPPYIDITNNNDFDVTVLDRNWSSEFESYQFTIPAGGAHRISLTSSLYSMNFYVQDQHEVTFKWFAGAKEIIDDLTARVAALEAAVSTQ